MSERPRPSITRQLLSIDVLDQLNATTLPLPNNFNSPDFSSSIVSSVTKHMTEGAKTKIETKDSSKPFIIRGHHLRNFLQLIKNNWSPNETAEKIHQEVILHPKPYIYDVMGNVPRQQTAYKKRLEKIFDKFLQLDPEAPVDLIEEQKDEICKACLFGQHCTSGAKKDGYSDSDFLFLQKFLDFSEPDQYEVTKDLVTYRKEGPIKLLRIKTTAGVVKKFLKGMTDQQTEEFLNLGN